MGSSAKKKKEKKKDFQKAKLKVGKAKVKASNITDTSFTAKTINFKKQSISTSAPSAALQFSHHVSMLRSKSDSQRAESLANLTSAYTTRPADSSPPESTAVILPKLQPLLLDGSGAVRQQLLRLLKCLPSDDIRRKPDQLLLYIHAAMTHLSVDIRLFSMEVLDWLLSVAGDEVVRCAGGWMKSLRRFVGLLGWEQNVKSANNWSSFQGGDTKNGREAKLISKQLTTLANFIKIGLQPPSVEATKAALAVEAGTFPYRHMIVHCLPHRSNAFSRLNLFGIPRNEDEQMYEDRQERQKIFNKYFTSSMQAGIENMKREGGEIGRATALVTKALNDGMSDADT